MSAQALSPSPAIPFGRRLLALDQLRGFVIVLVVLHHSMLAYTTFGHTNRFHFVLSTAPIVDPHHWIGFDTAVKLNDGFFMPLLFLLSGLFVWGGLTRKGPWNFLRGRLLRLGLPFAIAELTVVPLAYYPSYLQAGGLAGFSKFWVQTVTAGPWPSGPPWFIAVLLLFDVIAILAFALSRRSVAGPFEPAIPTPLQCFGLLLAGTTLLYLPLLLLFGPFRWLSVGPVAVQASRVLLYAAYFAAGVTLGMSGMSSIIRFGDVLKQRWARWVGFAFLAAAAFVQTGALYATLSKGLPPWSGPGFAGISLAIYCAAACFALPALFLRFGGRPGPIWASLAANSFAIYLLHYPAVTWIQYAFLAISFNAVGKGVATFTMALTASWAMAALLRRIPGLERVI